MHAIHRNLAAALEEMQVWVRIMAEHAKFIRLGLDPNPAQERLFRQADQFAVCFDQLYQEVLCLQYHAPDPVLYDIRERTIRMVDQLIAFKRQIFNALQACQGLAILPAGLVDHIRREADRFNGTLLRSKGRQTRTREILGIPDGGRLAQTLPRLMYDEVPRDTLFTVAVEEIMFFSRIHSEHAAHLAMTFRPEVQESYRRRALEFERALAGQIERARAVERTGQGLNGLLGDNIRLASEWRDYLSGLFNDLVTCRIPTGQMNSPPLLIDHMLRETLYYLDILGRLDRML